MNMNKIEEKIQNMNKDKGLINNNEKSSNIYSSKQVVINEPSPEKSDKPQSNGIMSKMRNSFLNKLNKVNENIDSKKTTITKPVVENKESLHTVHQAHLHTSSTTTTNNLTNTNINKPNNDNNSTNNTSTATTITNTVTTNTQNINKTNVNARNSITSNNNTTNSTATGISNRLAMFQKTSNNTSTSTATTTTTTATNLKNISYPIKSSVNAPNHQKKGSVGIPISNKSEINLTDNKEKESKNVCNAVKQPENNNINNTVNDQPKHQFVAKPSKDMTKENFKTSTRKSTLNSHNSNNPFANKRSSTEGLGMRSENTKVNNNVTNHVNENKASVHPPPKGVIENKESNSVKDMLSKLNNVQNNQNVKNELQNNVKNHEQIKTNIIQSSNLQGKIQGNLNSTNSNSNNNNHNFNETATTNLHNKTRASRVTSDRDTKVLFPGTTSMINSKISNNITSNTSKPGNRMSTSEETNKINAERKDSLSSPVKNMIALLQNTTKLISPVKSSDKQMFDDIIKKDEDSKGESKRQLFMNALNSKLSANIPKKTTTNESNDEQRKSNVLDVGLKHEIIKNKPMNDNVIYEKDEGGHEKEKENKKESEKENTKEKEKENNLLPMRMLMMDVKLKNIISNKSDIVANEKKKTSTKLSSHQENNITDILMEKKHSEKTKKKGSKPVFSDNKN